MKTITKVQKIVTVLAVYKFRKVARICFEVLSSDGKTHYHTCFQGNGRESCDCPSKSTCYHLNGLRTQAQAYFKSQQEKTSPAPVPQSAEVIDEVAAVAEQAAEAKLAAFRAGMVAQYASDPRVEKHTSGLAESYSASWYPKSMQ